MSAEIKDAIYWLETDRVVPNPYQPRREFDERALSELADSIKQYGVLQPLVVSRMESQKEDGNIEVVYELIAGERRLRASQKAGLSQVPCVIRVGDTNRQKLELAIIENVVREDLNAVERAMAYQRLADEFKLNWTEIAKKVSKSREYVNNTVRILMLPQEMLDALSKGKISEGHTRPLLMLIDRPEEQVTLFKEMLVRKMTVREAEKIARKIAFEKVRKKNTFVTPDVVEMENNLAEVLGTRVSIDPKEKGGKIQIDYFSYDELMGLVRMFKNAGHVKSHKGMFDVIREEGLTPSSYTEDILIARDAKDDNVMVDIANNLSLSNQESFQDSPFQAQNINSNLATNLTTNLVTNLTSSLNNSLDVSLTSGLSQSSNLVVDNVDISILKTQDKDLSSPTIDPIPLPEVYHNNAQLSVDNVNNTLPDVRQINPDLEIYDHNKISIDNIDNIQTRDNPQDNNNIKDNTLDINNVVDNDMNLTPAQESKVLDDRSIEEKFEDNNRTEDDLYSIKDWTI